MNSSSLSAVKLSADQRRKTRKLDNAGEANRDVAKMTGGGVRRIPKAQVTAQFKCILRIWCCGNLVASRFWVGISVRAHGFRHLFLPNTTPNHSSPNLVGSFPTPGNWAGKSIRTSRAGVARYLRTESPSNRGAAFAKQAKIRHSQTKTSPVRNFRRHI